MNGSSRRFNQARLDALDVDGFEVLETRPRTRGGERPSRMEVYGDGSYWPRDRRLKRGMGHGGHERRTPPVYYICLAIGAVYGTSAAAIAFVNGLDLLPILGLYAAVGNATAFGLAVIIALTTSERVDFE